MSNYSYSSNCVCSSVSSAYNIHCFQNHFWNDSMLNTEPSGVVILHLPRLTHSSLSRYTRIYSTLRSTKLFSRIVHSRSHLKTTFIHFILTVSCSTLNYLLFSPFHLNSCSTATQTTWSILVIRKQWHYISMAWMQPGAFQHVRDSTGLVFNSS